MAIFRKATAILLAGVIAPAMTSAVPDRTEENPAWQNVPDHPPHTDHSTFFKGPFPDGPAVTRACLECHEEAAQEVMQTSHWNWQGEEVMIPGHEEPMRIGKRNVINNFCIGVQSNWPACTSCHIGYGWEDEDFDFTDQSRVDCLVCHDNSGDYAKKSQGAGYPDESVDLLASAKSVGLPKRSNCGACHFQGGGGNAVKHGDMDNTLLFPSAGIDFHMGNLNLHCIDCHQAEDHELPGRAMSVSVDRKNRLRCTNCHPSKPHEDVRLNAHTDRVACQTCHVPYMAVEDPTKMTWDWSEAGQDLGITDDHIYLKIKGRFTYAKGVEPEYYWYNETSSRYILGDKIDPTQPTKLNAPLGSRDDVLSKVYPFKVHRGKQIYDVVNRHFILPNVHGDQGFWTQFDWDTAARLGSEVTGLDYSGVYGFAPTEMFWPLNHMVASQDKALQCRDCHGERGRLDWQALGYRSDPLGRPALEHMPIPLLDAQGEPVQESGQPLSTAMTCGQCHEVGDESFIAKHGYHTRIHVSELPKERQLLMRDGPRIPQSKGEQMNCFLCHISDPNHEERRQALQNGLEDWSVTATLVGTGVVQESGDNYVWSAAAFQDEMAELGIKYVSESNCGGCHGGVHDGATPLLVDIGSRKEWVTEKTGQVFSPQRIRLSGMNLRNKDSLNRAWDVHAERLVQCGDCHYSQDRPLRLAGELRQQAVATLGEQRRRCDSCHSLVNTHTWLPNKDRHIKAVACESCHVPYLYMAAQEQIDATVVRLDGNPQILYRGVKGDTISRPAAAYIRGYQPLVLIGESVDGEDKVIPYNLVSKWYWVDGETGQEVSEEVVRTAWTDSTRYRAPILGAFDANQDGLLDNQELRLDSYAKVLVVKERLREAGVRRPEIRGELRSYHIHHNVTHGELVNRDCSVCHPKFEEYEQANQAFELAAYVPGGVMPERVGGEDAKLDGNWQITKDGRLVFVRNQSIADSYQALTERAK